MNKESEKQAPSAMQASPIMDPAFGKPPVEKLGVKELQEKAINIDVLRLDKIHPVISGNKWYKLSEYLKDAMAQNKKVIVTFGGAFSNHIIAAAAACGHFQLSSIGIIRGEQPAQLSHTLLEAQHFGMELIFTSRSAYAARELPSSLLLHYREKDLYIIPEGGYGPKGMQGAQAILTETDAESYTHICAAVGTGTMLAGLIRAVQPHQQVLGISVLKNNFEVEGKIQQLLPHPKTNYSILHQFHFGGYAKYTSELIVFMNNWYRHTGIPTDFVYTAKLFYAVSQLAEQGYFKRGSRVLLIHSGGLQGNRSLAKGILEF